MSIYIGIAVVLLLSIIGFLVISRHWSTVLRETEFENRRLELISAIRAELEGAGEDLTDQLLVINMFSLTHRMSIWLSSMVELPLSSEEKERLQSGELVTVEMDRGFLQTYAIVSDNEALVLGPYRLGEMMRWQDDIIDLDGRPRWREGPGLGEFGRGREGLPGGRRGLPPPRPGRLLWGFDFLLLSILAVSFLLIGAAIYVLIRPLERRIRGLSEVTEQFGHGDLSSRAVVKKDDAVAELAERFNWMADRIEGLVEGQRDLMRAVSHELRTPLARLFFLIERLEKVDVPDEKVSCILRIRRSLADLNDLVEELLSFARVEHDLDPTAVEIVDVSRELWEMPDVAMELREDVSVEISCNESLKLMAIPRYFRRALMNLVTNAVRHAESHILIEGATEGETVQVVVEDDGPGIPAALRGKVLEPFFRVDESRSEKIGGTGLGLAIVQRIMKLHGGSVGVEEGGEGGARFILSFPQAVLKPELSEQDVSI